MKMAKGKKIAVTGFCIFIVFMAVCTIIAKGIYRYSLPQVTTQAPYSGNLTHEIKANGIVKQGEEYGIFVEDGLRISTVTVRNGEYFEEDMPLFQIDTEDLQGIIEEKELEIKKLKSLQEETIETENDKIQGQQTEVLRAKEDYNNLAKEEEAKIEKCQQTLESARQELLLYDEYLSRLQNNNQVSEGDSYDEIYTKQYERQTKRYLLVQNVISCSQALEDEELQKEIRLQAASRAIEDAGKGSSKVNSSMDSNNWDITWQEKKLLELKELIDAEGWIYSETAGRVIDCRVAPGYRTKDEACILYASDDGERIIQAVFTEDSGSYLALNAQLSLKANLPDGSSGKDDVLVSYMEVLDSGDIMTELSIGNLDLSIGQTVELSYRAQTSNFAACVPVACLHNNEQGGSYVYVVEEKEGILGTEWKVREVFVTILDQTDTVVAIESAEITADTRIVVTFTNELTNGDVVRLL